MNALGAERGRHERQGVTVTGIYIPTNEALERAATYTTSSSLWFKDKQDVGSFQQQ